MSTESTASAGRRRGKAALLMWQAIDDKGIKGRLRLLDCTYLARVLDEHGHLTNEGRLSNPAPDATTREVRALSQTDDRVEESK